MEEIGAAAESRPAHPEDVAFVVILPRILLDRAQDAAPAEGVTQKVDEAARGAGIFELRAFEAGDQLGRDDRHVGIPVETLEKRFEPAGGGLDIGIQKDVVIGLDPFERTVVSAGKTVVAVHAQQRDRRELPAEQRHRTVRRSVVGHDDLHPVRSGSDDAWQETAQVVLAVPIQYDDLSGCHRSSYVCVSSGGATTSRVRAARG